jgi:hypothetical protein
MSMTEGAVHEDAARLTARRAHIARQLDLMLETRGPVAVVRRLVADLDSISEDLARALRTDASIGES